MNFASILTEIKIKATRSGGKGGQNVNKVSSRVQLFFDLQNSNGLSDEEKILLTHKLKNKITEEGILILDVQEERSQYWNRKLAIDKLEELLIHSLKKQKKRIATKISKAKKKKRAVSKRKNSDKKKQRSKKYSSGD